MQTELNSLHFFACSSQIFAPALGGGLGLDQDPHRTPSKLESTAGPPEDSQSSAHLLTSLLGNVLHPGHRHRTQAGAASQPLHLQGPFLCCTNPCTCRGILAGRGAVITLWAEWNITFLPRFPFSITTPMPECTPELLGLPPQCSILPGACSLHMSLSLDSL